MKFTWPRTKDGAGNESCCCPECGETVDETSSHCDRCGYDIVQQAKTHLGRPGSAGLA